jgi:uracil-DNA glycosylase
MTMTLSRCWRELMNEEIEKPYVKELRQFLAEEKKKGHPVYPPEDLEFNAFSHTPYKDVKVVIMGQDPYHGPGQAHGLSFSVLPGTPIPPSLRNIYKELHADLGIIPPNHGCLEPWAKQGVLLLNATLTVREGMPRSHHGKGWEMFTDSVVRLLCARPQPIIFMLWGKSAQEKCESIFDLHPHPHVILKAAHPSPFSAKNFHNCKHFSIANDILKRWGQKPINWDLKK